MAIVKVYKDLLTGTTHAGAGAVTAEARAYIGFGRPARGNTAAEGRGSMGVGEILKVEFKGDDANVNVNTTLTLTDIDGRLILSAPVLSGATDDSTLLVTEQEAVIGATVTAVSTVGRGVYLAPDPGVVYDKGGDVSGAGEGKYGGVVAHGPILATILLGTDGDYHRVTLWVRV